MSMTENMNDEIKLTEEQELEFTNGKGDDE